MADEPIENQTPHDRRNFFRSSLARLLRPAADFIEKRLPTPLPVLPPALRPPGALSERSFLETCFRCGQCADNCPADAIVLWEGDDEDLRGTPYIDPDKRGCVICDELSCMKGCPSGALKRLDRLAIRIGLARVDHSLCLRSTGDDCTTCIDMCPISSTAIGLDADGRVAVVNPEKTGQGCTGCGVCQEYCPTRPKRAIRIFPY
ncbi:MAG: 4Fe-4S dicluster domain-containing protein [Phycisphaerae bacterium]